jgi:hypothetical protein
LLLSWIVFPLLLLLICLGCGLLVRELSGVTVSGPLLAPLGFAVVIVIGELTTVGGTTTQLLAPLAVAAAVGGFLLAAQRPGWRRIEPWAVAAGAVVFAVYAAPIVLSGEPTFGGYIKLDDTSTWLAITDRLMDHGRDIGGLAPSTYEATLSFNLGSGYPVGVFLPLGMSVQLLGRDAAWLFQPYMAFMALMLALCLYAIAGELIRSRPLRAAVAAIAAQPALLFGYYLWGGIKELASAALLALLVPLIPAALEGWRSWRSAIPAAVAASALIGVLSIAGAAVWLGPALVLGALIGIRRHGLPDAAKAAIVFLAVLAAVTLPWLLPGGLLPREAGVLTDPRELGNLAAPLSLWQGFGIWPVGDFRFDTSDPTLTTILLIVLIVAAIAGGVIARRQRALVPPLFCLALVLGGAGLVILGSPWVDAKALATASTAVLFAGAAGAGALVDRGSRIEGGVALAAIAAGVLWSNALAYQEEWLAPHDRLAELERVAGMIDGEGPTLMTEYEPYGVRHFLRDADPEGASELRRRTIPLRGGGTLEQGGFADIDRFDLQGLLVYRTLVMRRSPMVSRPPLPFELVWKGHFWEIWQQPDGAPTPIEHLSLESPGSPFARPSCAEVERLARKPGVGEIATARRRPPVVVELGTLERPSDWPADENNAGTVYPNSSGSAGGELSLPGGGPRSIWLGGSWRGRATVYIDGREVGSARAVFDHPGGYTELARVELGPGRHRMRLGYEEGGLAPGSGGPAFGFGPIVLAQATDAGDQVDYLRPQAAPSVCGRNLDWVEALPG